jgi:TfoX/Sxy family transcriptional regulator of competence genes
VTRNAIIASVQRVGSIVARALFGNDGIILRSF